MFICEIFRAIGFTIWGWLKIIDEGWATDLVTSFWDWTTPIWGCVYG